MNPKLGILGQLLIWGPIAIVLIGMTVGLWGK
jgi:hypothetical protein